MKISVLNSLSYRNASKNYGLHNLSWASGREMHLLLAISLKNSLTNLLTSLPLGSFFLSFPKTRKAKYYSLILTSSYFQRKKTQCKLYYIP